MDDEAIIERAREHDVEDLASRYLEAASAGAKFACPVCPSSDALVARGDHAVCYSANHPGGGEAVMDGIELVRESTGCGFVKAVERITGHRLDQDGGGGGAPETPERSRSPDTSGDESEGDGSTTFLLNRLLDVLDLSEPGAAYLESRGLDPELCRQLGIVDATRPEWGAWCGQVESDAVLEASGLVVERGGEPDLHPWYQHFLLIPYWIADPWCFAPEVDDEWYDDAELGTVRFRSCDGTDQPKMLSVTSDGPSRSPVPYLEGSVGAAQQYRWPLFVVEGELDALSIVQCGWPAVATNSASVWREGWCDGWGEIPQIVAVAEGDAAGDRFVDTVFDTASDVFGDEFTRAKMSKAKLEEGEDCNDLIQAGGLKQKVDRVVEQLSATGDV